MLWQKSRLAEILRTPCPVGGPRSPGIIESPLVHFYFGVSRDSLWSSIISSSIASSLVVVVTVVAVVVVLVTDVVVSSGISATFTQGVAGVGF